MTYFPTLPLLHLSAFFIYLFLIIAILLFNARALTNRVAAALIFCFALWSFGKVFVHYRGTPGNTADIIETIIAPGWIFFPAFMLWFVKILTEKKHALAKPAFYFLLFLPPVIIWLAVLTGFVFNPAQLKPFGWYRQWHHAYWMFFYYSYLFAYVTGAVVILFMSKKSLLNNHKKRYINIIFGATAITFVVGFSVEMAEILFPHIGMQFGLQADITDLYVLAWAAALIYAMYRYNFLALTPIVASERILESMNEGLLIVNDDVEIIYSNNRANALTGFLLDNSYPTHLYSLFPNTSIAGEFLKRTLKENGVSSFETEVKSASGTLIPVLISSTVLRIGGDFAGIACMISDITKLKLAEKAYVENLKKQIELSKMKTGFISMVSHELRTPLTAIKGALVILLGNTAKKLNDSDASLFDIMQRNSDRLLNLINDLLDSAKMESGNFTIEKSDIDIDLLFREAITGIEPIARRKMIQINYVSRANESNIHADPVRIVQSITNLINNAIKFSPEHSIIRCSLSEIHPHHESIPENVRKEGFTVEAVKYFRITVADDGVGLRQDDLAHIFDLFYQAKENENRKQPGTGLGLTIAKNIISRHRGVIWAESDGPGRGTTFTILLPQR